MKKVRIVGVPEHFNLPWHMAIDEGAFASRGIDLEWTDVPEGSGKMCQLLADQETDLAIVLTDGIVKSISDGNTSKIVQQYIASPLLWGIHVAENSSYENLEDLKGTTAAISRFGSGSHLMSYVNASNLQWNLATLKFEVVHTLDKAVTALTDKRADYFMWERFTTKPLVDKKIFRRLADCPTPWPCFMIVATDAFLEEHSGLLKHILAVINRYTEEIKSIPSIDRTFANGYHQNLEDIQKWLSLTRWSQSPLGEAQLDKVKETLINLNLLGTILDNDRYLWNSKH